MKVVILAGGLGTRLSEETKLRPKPMVEIGGRPILWHIMKIYAAFGYQEFCIALGYKGDEIKKFFMNYQAASGDFSINLKNGEKKYYNSPREDWMVHLIDTGDSTLTGGRVFRLRHFLKNEETFMLTYGDGVSNIDIKELVKFHKSHGKIATITAVRPPARFGALQMEGKQVIDFHEKVQLHEGWINGGFMVLNREVFNYLDDDTNILEKGPLEGLARDRQLMAFHHEGFWQPMDTIRDRDFLNSLWNSGSSPWQIWKE
ncbi:MAG: glucose-1-phosphate cytidylyltransferase [Bdellovibrionales bacterium GWA2_49_15]|nr:MAG: glucose-1-phosphate cytidylyltransferase [Bdellovibrionales bacterium GWA2_49_15]HAZ11712.1 glucose-1-phosphate cytidylyltransferase [Bdellovibrionales bacterium]